MDADGRNARVIAVPKLAGLTLTPAGSPAFSPDSRFIAFAADDEESTGVGRSGGVYRIRGDGTGLRSILSEAFSPAWSVRNRIAVAAGGIFTVDANGASPRPCPPATRPTTRPGRRAYRGSCSAAAASQASASPGAGSAGL